jgi:membrane-bound serine protease (ClpP class)
MNLKFQFQNLRLFVLSLLIFLNLNFLNSELLAIDLNSKVVVLEINDYSFVNLEQIEYLKDSLSDINDSNPEAVIFKIDCSSGLASELRNFIEEFSKLKIPSVAFITGKSAGAGAVVSLFSDFIYLSSQDFVIGGESSSLEWRGPSEALPKRLTDLRYHDLIESFSILNKNNPIRNALVTGVCDIEKETKIGGDLISRSGDVLVFDESYFKKFSLEGGVASNVMEIINQRGFNGEVINIPAPKIIINRPKKRPNLSTKNKLNEINNSDINNVSEDSNFGQTKLDSYEGKVVVIEVGMDSLIRETKFDFMKRVIKKADNDKASAIVFDLNTPGGVAWYTEEIMLSDLQNLKIPTYSFVNPKAMSAGALIAIATDYIYMHEPSTIGAAAPVMGNGQDIPEAMLKKVLSDILATADDVARLKGHDPNIAKAFVDTKVELLFEMPIVTAEGNLEFVSAFDPDTENDLLVLNAWQATQVIDGRPLFAEGLASSIDDLIEKAGLTGDVVLAEPLGFEFVSDLIVKLAPWLLLFGIAGAYMELKAPGFGLPGFVSLIAFSLFFFGHNVAGYLTGYEIIGVFILGFILLIFEFFVFPGLLVFGLIGTCCIIGSLIYTMIDPVDLGWSEGLNPSNFLSVLSEPMMNLSIALLGSTLVIFLLMRYMNSLPMTRWMVLDESLESGTGININESSDPITTLVGLKGELVTDLKPSGVAIINNIRVDVVSDGEFLEKGEVVTVLKEEGSRILVGKDE